MRLHGLSIARKVQLLAALVLVGLLPTILAALYLERSSRDNKRDALDRSLALTAAGQEAQLSTYFAEARTLILFGAQDNAYADFYALPGSREQKVRDGGKVLDEVNDGLAYFEHLYAGAISEVCFIDQGGAENARVVAGVRATPDDLSPDEAKNPFFAPTFALQPGAVYQGSPYVSPDTHEWVIGNATQLVAGGRTRALLHFEVSIESFRRQAARLAGHRHVLVVDPRTGAVVLDSAKPQRKGAKLGVPGERSFAGLVKGAGRSGFATVDGERVAYRRIARTAHNVNDWWVVVAAPAVPGGLSGIELGPVALLLAALLPLIGALLLVLFVRRVVVRIRTLTEASDRAADGDLTVRLADESEDELGRLSAAFNRMVDSLAEMVGRIGDAGGAVSARSQEVAASSSEASRAVGDIASAVGEVAAGTERQVRLIEDAQGAAERIAETIDASADNARETAAAAREAQTAAGEGVAAVDQARDTMDAVRESSAAARAAIHELSQRSEQIGGIIETITRIAGQTNLLALNAAIEAARAGEQGRGFAVVADEVRKLAEESERAASSIGALISEMQSETGQVVDVVGASAEQSEHGAVVVREARDAFRRIGERIEDVTARVEHIAQAAGAISENAQSMRSTMSEIASVTEQSSAGAHGVSASTQQTSASTYEITAAADELASTADDLAELVRRFKTAA